MTHFYDNQAIKLKYFAQKKVDGGFLLFQGIIFYANEDKKNKSIFKINPSLLCDFLKKVFEFVLCIQLQHCLDYSHHVGDTVSQQCGIIEGFG